MPKDKEKLSQRGHWKPYRKKCENVFFCLCLDTRSEGPKCFLISAINTYLKYNGTQGISLLELIVMSKKYPHFKETETKQ